MVVGVSNPNHGVFSTDCDEKTLEIMCHMVGKVDVITVHHRGDRHVFREEEPREYTQEDCVEIFRTVERYSDAQNGI